VQRAELLAAPDGLLGLSGLLARPSGIDMLERLERRVELFDSCQEVIRHLDGRYLLLADHFPDAPRGQPCEVVAARRGFNRRRGDDSGEETAGQRGASRRDSQKRAPVGDSEAVRF
jgi:hypothetical protein